VAGKKKHTTRGGGGNPDVPPRTLARKKKRQQVRQEHFTFKKVGGIGNAALTKVRREGEGESKD